MNDKSTHGHQHEPIHVIKFRYNMNERSEAPRVRTRDDGKEKVFNTNAGKRLQYPLVLAQTLPKSSRCSHIFCWLGIRKAPQAIGCALKAFQSVRNSNRTVILPAQILLTLLRSKALVHIRLHVRTSMNAGCKTRVISPLRSNNRSNAATNHNSGVAACCRER